MILVSCLPNYSKADKVDGLIVVLEGPKLIHHEEKVVVVFQHPPKAQQAEEFDCWVICQFVHITEEGDESTFFNRPIGRGSNVKDVVEVAEVVSNSMSESTELDDSDDNVLQGIAELLESHMASRAPAINTKDVWLIHNLFPGMVEDDKQQLN